MVIMHLITQVLVDKKIERSSFFIRRLYEKVLKVILGIILSVVLVLGLLYGLFIYMIEYHVETVAKESYYEYEVVMQSVGAPLFFSSADGRLLLKKNDTIINKIGLYIIR